jgi:hypothetical protein
MPVSIRQPGQQAVHPVKGGIKLSGPGIRTPSGQWLMISLLLLSLPAVGASQELVTRNPYMVEAAFLRNFAHYVTWPPHAFIEDRDHWHICVLGPDPFGDILETTLGDRTEQGRSFTIFRADRLEELPACQIVFIAFKDAGKRRSVLNALKEQPVLTVGEAEEFLNEGGVIRFQVNSRVRMGINLDQSRRVLLEIQTKMLEVSRIIVENGEIRQPR